MNIEKEIIKRLSDNGKVVLIGFGSFVTNDKTAELNSETNTFIPPSKTVSFIPNETDYDNSFVNYLSAENNLSYGESQNAVNVLIADIKNNLEKYGKHIFNGFGLLSFNKEEYVFDLNPNVNLSADAVGMESFTSSEIKREKVEPPKTVSQKRKSKVWLVLLIALLVLIGATVGAYFAFPDQAKKCVCFAENQLDAIKNKFSKKEEPLKKDEKTKVVSGDKLKTKDNKNAKNETEKVAKIPTDTACKKMKDVSANTNTKDTPVKEKSVDPNAKMYYIVAGSFRSKENAEKFVAELKAKSYPNAVMLDNPKKGLFTVAYDRFTDKETANQELKKINNKEKSGSWLILE